jgi:serine phosphatase RsbU (regulator of sigma subunit)/anti-sigma regulatory factor (Ser/Thr protein kinase)
VLLLGLALFLQTRNAALASEQQRLAQVLGQADHAGDLLDTASRSVLSFDREHRSSDLAAYNAVRRRLPQTLASLNILVGSNPPRRDPFVRLKRAMGGGFAVVTEYLRLVRARDTAGKLKLVKSPRVKYLSTEISSARADFSVRERVAAGQPVRPIVRQIALLTVALIAMCLAGILVTLALSIRFGLNITRRVVRLADNARRLADGDDAQPIGGNDEIAELDIVYREMMNRVKREHHMVTILQRALLPETLPLVGGVRLDAAYVPAARGTEVGGDWYDVFPISDQLLGISVGDVAGHGLRAATIMGQARQALRTASYVSADPAAALEYVNRVLCRSENDVLITAFFATLDLTDGQMKYSLAGHPPPMFVRTGGPVQTLPGRGFVLGVDARAEYETLEAKIDVGSAVVFFTDGLVEAERNYFAGIEALRDAIEQEYRNASRNIAQAIVSRVFARRPPRDDVALLFLGVTSLSEAVAPQRRTWRLDAGVERSARRVKRALLWQLGELTGDGADLSAAELIVNELIGNVARHTPGPAEVLLEWRDDVAVVTVCDRGEPFKVDEFEKRADVLSEDGRGLFLVRAMSEQFKVERTKDGNCVSAVLPLDVRCAGRDRARSPRRMQAV